MKDDVPVLQLANVTVRYGGVHALSGVDLLVHPGELVGIVGPNGAGKTTLFDAITGLTRARGVVQFLGAPLRRRFTRWHSMGALASMVLTALFILALAANFDRMWAVTFKHTAGDKGLGMSCVKRAAQYLMGAPHIEALRHGFAVVSHDGKRVFGSHQTVPEARNELARSQDLAKMLSAPARRYRAFAAFLGATLGLMGYAVIFMRSARSPAFIAQQGIARTFQSNRPFKNMSVLENVMVAASAPRAWRSTRPKMHVLGLPACIFVLHLLVVVRLHGTQAQGPLATILFLAWLVALFLFALPLLHTGVLHKDVALQRHQVAARSEEILAEVGLDGDMHRRAATLAYGEARRLEIARALATEPRLILLDEPAAGLNATESLWLRDLLKRLKDKKKTIILIEHDMPLTLAVSDRLVVLENGKKIADGAPEDVARDPRVIAAYLGDASAHP